MADTKTPEQAAEDEDVKKVDAMMAVNDKDGTPAVSTSVDTESFKKPKTAPKLPSVYKPKEPTKPPLVIKLVDEKSPAAASAKAAESAPAVTGAAPTPASPEPAADPAAPTDEPAPPSEPGGSANLDDTATDQAVDDIAAKESDMVLAVEDARNAKKAGTAKPPTGWKTRFKRFFKSKWAWAGLVVIILAVLAVPATRYPVLGLFLKQPVTLTILDSKSKTPVSQAEVILAGHMAKTDADGKVSFDAKVGRQSLTVSKQYYQDLHTTYFVGFKKAASPPIQIAATGRLVPIVVVDGISGKPLANVQLQILNTSAKTNSSGHATIVLPAKLSSADYTASLGGYLTNQGAVMVTDKVVPTNTIRLIASGKIYFLSNKSGTIDVVKTNLDGSDRQVVLAGTGHEDPNSTTLLASRDWRYLVLESRRSGSNNTLSLIDTSTDKVTTFDTTNADFTLVGWYNHYFLYEAVQNSQPVWQAGREILDSYNADNQQLSQLDQNQATGTSDSYSFQTFSNFYILNGVVAYTTQWVGPTTGQGGQNCTIRAVQPNGQNKKDYETFAAADTTYIQATLYSPQAVYYAVYGTSGQAAYYEFENQSAKTASLDSDAFTQTYPTYLISPSGNQTFWTELRDGKNTLFIGDDNAGNKKQIAADTDYSPYGWYSDNYVLVSKNSSELYIMPASGLGAGQQPLKITDYYKPVQSFNGYGYGYGGL